MEERSIDTGNKQEPCIRIFERIDREAWHSWTSTLELPVQGVVTLDVAKRYRRVLTVERIDGSLVLAIDRMESGTSEITVRESNVERVYHYKSRGSPEC